MIQKSNKIEGKESTWLCIQSQILASFSIFLHFVSPAQFIFWVEQKSENQFTDLVLYYASSFSLHLKKNNLVQT
jgi:hypothetical protein